MHSRATGVSHGHASSAKLASLKLLHLLLGLAMLCKPPTATARRQQQQDQSRPVAPEELHAPLAKTAQVAPPLGMQCVGAGSLHKITPQRQAPTCELPGS